MTLGRPVQSHSTETRPIIMTMAVTRRRVASVFRARKARKAADAMKKARSANMVEAIGAFTVL